MQKINITKFLIKKIKEMSGVKRWEIASEKMELAREFRRIGQKFYDSKATA